MIEALKDEFDQIFSIELDKDLYVGAVRKFSGYKHINLYYGDSSEELSKVTQELHAPALFWLDAHYSKGETAHGAKATPIIDEITHVLNSDEAHVILVDDARMFGSDPEYPTVGEIAKILEQMRGTPTHIDVMDDIIRIKL